MTTPTKPTDDFDGSIGCMLILGVLLLAVGVGFVVGAAWACIIAGTGLLVLAVVAIRKKI